ncbi:hypothetical protein B0H66DRAFT_24641 [Apodospora peruviana]|uniref:Uncharacterized protein n=1 Tax=Apodospora peruviana TaxID=516989 RepID=A0AAE0MEG0_9PEZI|nr:hypothetical protein B0H66DRAFT_24641 [Apodospora peruviana]
MAATTTIADYWQPIGPLTTTYTEPEWCSRYFVRAGVDGETMFRGNFLLAPIPTPAPPCAISGFVWGGYYSPGVCPSGWTSVGVPTDSTLPGETASYCCPSEHTLSLVSDTMCWSEVGFGLNKPMLTIDEIIFDKARSTSSTTRYTTSGPLEFDMTRIHEGKTDTYRLPVRAVVYPVQVRFQASDASILGAAAFATTTPTPTVSSSTAGSEPGGSLSRGIRTTDSTEGTGLPDYNSVDQQGLSTVVKVGLGVGVSLLSISLGILAFLFFYCRGRRNQNNKRQSIYSAAGLPGMPEVEGAEMYEKEAVSRRQELPTSPGFWEAASSDPPRPVYELDTHDMPPSWPRATVVRDRERETEGQG